MPTKNKPSRKRAADNGKKVCFATKNIVPREEALRFVASPAREVVFDAAESLPGTGMWLSASREVVQLAMTKRLFYKAAGGTVKIPENLLQIIETALKERCKNFLSLARKAGLLVFGFENVKKALAEQKGAVVFEAQDSALNGQNKLFRPTDSFPVFSFLTREELGEITGQDIQVHMLVLKSNLAGKLIASAQKLNRFMQDSTKG